MGGKFSTEYLYRYISLLLNNRNKRIQKTEDYISCLGTIIFLFQAFQIKFRRKYRKCYICFGHEYDYHYHYNYNHHDVFSAYFLNLDIHKHLNFEFLEIQSYTLVLRCSCAIPSLVPSAWLLNECFYFTLFAVLDNQNQMIPRSLSCPAKLADFLLKCILSLILFFYLNLPEVSCIFPGSLGKLEASLYFIKYNMANTMWIFKEYNRRVLNGHKEPEFYISFNSECFIFSNKGSW